MTKLWKISVDGWMDRQMDGRADGSLRDSNSLFGLFENRFSSLHSFMCFMCAKSTYLKGRNTHSRWSPVVHLWPTQLLQHHALWCEYEQWRTLNMKPGWRFQDTLTAVKHGVWSHGKINIYDDNEREREKELNQI